MNDQESRLSAPATASGITRRAGSVSCSTRSVLFSRYSADRQGGIGTFSPRLVASVADTSNARIAGPVLKRTAVALACMLATVGSLTLNAPAAVAAESVGGVIQGAVSCINYKNLTKVRVQAQTGEAADATIQRKSNWNGSYKVSLRTIKGGYNGTGTKVLVYAYCDNRPAGGKQQTLFASKTHVWIVNLFNCGSGKCKA